MSNAAVQMGICSVCVHECNTIEDRLFKIYLDLLPNTNHLILQKAHPACKLFDGKLLKPSAMKIVNGQH